MKKGIELSINFLVTIIIALVIFAFGLRFIYNIAADATELESLTTDDLDDRIGQLLCESTDRVCIGIDRKTIDQGDFDIFGLKIINVQDGKDFEVEVDAAGFTVNNQPIEAVGVGEIDIKYNGNLFIERNREGAVGIGVEVEKKAKSGMYIIDVQVKHDVGDEFGNALFENYGSLRKIYVEVP